MNLLIIDISVFILTYILLFFSISGYGKYLSKKFNNILIANNYFEYQIYGTIFALIISFIIQNIFGVNTYFNIFFFTIGFCLYIFTNNFIKNIKTSQILLLLFSLLSVLIISKTHEDFNSYHFFSINELYENKLRIGVNELSHRFFHSSLIGYVQILYVFPFLEYKLVHFPIFYLYVTTIGYFLYIVFNKTNSKEIFYSIFCIIVLLTKFSRLSEFGYDYTSQFLLLIVFHKIYFYKDKDTEIFKSILIFLFSFLIKPVTILFSPIFLLIFFKKNFFVDQFLNKRVIFFSLLLSIFFTASILRTGCLFYPINQTCFEKDKIFWSEKERIKNYRKVVTLWAKGFNHQDHTNYEIIGDEKKFTSNFNWLKYWIEVHFFYKIFEFILLVIFAYLLTYIFFKKKDRGKTKILNTNLIYIFLSGVSIFFWLLTAPQFRFGFASILIFIYLTLINIFKKNISFEKNRFFIIFFLCLFFLNIKNINRINSEFERDDFYKFKRFPYFNQIKIKNNYENIERYKFLGIEILKKKSE